MSEVVPLPLTPWGEWVATQPKGCLMDACRKTGLSWATVCRARLKRVNDGTARKLVRFARQRGSWLTVADVARPT